MSVKEIFSNLSAHMLKGIMFHNDMADYFNFMGYKGFKRMQEYAFICENLEYRRLNRYAINHLGALIPKTNTSAETHIPSALYTMSRENMDSNAHKNALEIIFDAWCSWEYETKKYYERLYNELFELNEIACCEYLMCLIDKVDKEQKIVDDLRVKLKSVDYNLECVLSMQEHLHKKYKKKMKKWSDRKC